MATPSLVACAMVFCLEKESRTISSAAFDAKNNCYKPIHADLRRSTRIHPEFIAIHPDQAPI
jgi:hypothetical protein